MRKIVRTITMLAAAGIFFSCAKAPVYKDGTYTATSEKDNWGGWADISITVKDKTIVECTFTAYDKDGTIKDKTYGMEDGQIKNAGIYKLAQASVEGGQKYPGILLEKQNIDKVDAVSGATVSHRLFQDAAKKALKDAVE
ncbi:MAG: FMN-binding protein [Treponema sp.]